MNEHLYLSSTKKIWWLSSHSHVSLQWRMPVDSPKKNAAGVIYEYCGWTGHQGGWRARRNLILASQVWLSLQLQWLGDSCAFEKWKKKTTLYTVEKSIAKVVFDEKLVKKCQRCQRCSSANSWIVSLLKRCVVCNNDETRRRRDGHLPRQCTRWASHLGMTGRQLQTQTIFATFLGNPMVLKLPKFCQGEASSCLDICLVGFPVMWTMKGHPSPSFHTMVGISEELVTQNT